MKARYRTLFISDCHLGSNGAQAEQLARYLKHVECEEIFLVGDIIDMWRLKQRWYWPDSHNSVLRRLLKMSHKGTKITYVPGNHDESARQFCGLVFGGIRIAMDAVHVTADGRRLLVTHGDKFDLVVRHSRLLSVAGAVGYEFLLKVNRWYNAGRRLFGLILRLRILRRLFVYSPAHQWNLLLSCLHSGQRRPSERPRAHARQAAIHRPAHRRRRWFK